MRKRTKKHKRLETAEAKQLRKMNDEFENLLKEVKERRNWKQDLINLSTIIHERREDWFCSICGDDPVHHPWALLAHTMDKDFVCLDCTKTILAGYLVKHKAELFTKPKLPLTLKMKKAAEPQRQVPIRRTIKMKRTP